MEYLLSEKEYENLDKIEYYDTLLGSVKIAAEHVRKSVCLLETGGISAYCDDCPIAHLWIKERHSNVRFCLRSKNFSK
jgi:hypothetical protein